jgi:hypothetical protein
MLYNIFIGMERRKAAKKHTQQIIKYKAAAAAEWLNFYE